MATENEIQAMRKMFQRQWDANSKKPDVDPKTGRFQGQAPDQVATPPNFDNEKGWSDESVVMTKGELKELLKEAMMQGTAAGNLQDPQNIGTRKQYTESGSFDEDAVNDARKSAERQGDLTHIADSVIARAKLRKKFDPNKIITFDDIQNDREKYTKRKGMQ